MSEPQQEDAFDNGLTKLERLFKIYDQTAEATSSSMYHPIREELAALRFPNMYTPYSMTIEAFHRISDLRNEDFAGTFEALVITMIKRRSVSQAALWKMSTINPFWIAFWERHYLGKLAEWLAIRHKLMTSFHAEGLVVKELNRVIESKAYDLVCWWGIDECTVRAGRTELYKKLKAFSGFSDPVDYPWIVEDIEYNFNQPRGSGGQPNTTECNNHILEHQRSPYPCPTMCEDERRSLVRQIKGLSSMVNGLELDLYNSNLGQEELESSKKELDKTKELLVEADEDCKTTMKENGLLVAENERLQTSMAAVVQEKAVMAGQVEKLCTEKDDLTMSVEQKQDHIDELNRRYDVVNQSLRDSRMREESMTTRKEALATANDDLETTLSREKTASHQRHELLSRENDNLSKLVEKKQIQIRELELKCDGLNLSLEEAKVRASVLVEEKEGLATANADLETSLSTAKESHAVLSKNVEDSKAEAAKRTTEIGYALDVMSDLKGRKEYWRQRTDVLEEEKAQLMAQLAEVKDSLHQATSTITATNMHDLTAENSRLEQDLKAANDVLAGMRAFLEPRSNSTGTVRHPDFLFDSKTKPANDLDTNEDTESDVGSTIMTPASTVDAGES